VVAGRGPELSGGGGPASGEGQEGGVGEDCGGAGEQGTGPAEGAIQYRGEQRAGADDADRGGDGQAVRPAEYVPRQHPLQAGAHRDLDQERGGAADGDHDQDCGGPGQQRHAGDREPDRAQRRDQDPAVGQPGCPARQRGSSHAAGAERGEHEGVAVQAEPG
jgi:hypothetical protein